MKTYTSIKLITLSVLFSGTTLMNANTTLLVNTEFSTFDEWNVGSNKFVGGVWQAFVGSADGTYTVDSRVDASGSGFVFNSWDDGTSDKLENFLYQEYGAGPAASTTPTIFETGDKIVFKGSASATKSGADTSDVVVRAFIKTLGYNELGWEFQTKAEYSDFYTITDTLQPFELSVVYPDIVADDSLQVIQLGFEATTSFDGTNMDSATIYFENLEGYIEEEVVETTWLGFTINANGFVDTGDWMGMLYVTNSPWVWSVALDGWLNLDETQNVTTGAWVYKPSNN